MAQIRHGKVISPARLDRKSNPETSKLVYAEGRFGATLRGVRMAPNKMRLVVDQIRGQRVERAREILRFSRKRAAYYLDRVLLSALGNADVRTEGRVGADELFVAEAYCDEGPRLKRFKSGPMGRARPILRRMCHVTVVLGEVPTDGGKDEKAPPAEEPKVKAAPVKKEEAPVAETKAEKPAAKAKKSKKAKKD
jgi:large subunit ribosomal protein L22